MKRAFFILVPLLLFTLPALQAQKKSLSAIETFPVNARVISLFEGQSNRGLIEILKVDSSNYAGLAVGDEIMLRFFFGSKGIKDQRKLKPFAAGDYLSLRMGAVTNRLSGQNEYWGFHYVKVPKERLAPKPAADSSAAIQK